MAWNLQQSWYLTATDTGEPNSLIKEGWRAYSANKAWIADSTKRLEMTDNSTLNREAGTLLPKTQVSSDDNTALDYDTLKH